MKLAMPKVRHRASEDPSRDGKPARFTMIGGSAGADAAPWAPVVPEQVAPRRELAPLVRLPVAPGRAPAPPRVVAEADLRVKRYRGGGAEDERYTATLRASAAAPAALLAALADAAHQIEDLVRDGSPDDHVVLNVTIRR